MIHLEPFAIGDSCLIRIDGVHAGSLKKGKAWMLVTAQGIVWEQWHLLVIIRAMLLLNLGDLTREVSFESFDDFKTWEEKRNKELDNDNA